MKTSLAAQKQCMKYLSHIGSSNISDYTVADNLLIDGL